MIKIKFTVELEPGVFHGRAASGRITREDFYTGTTEAFPDGTVHISTTPLYGPPEISELLSYLSEFCEEGWEEED